MARDEWAGWWMCTDGDVFPTREAAIEHLKVARYPETIGRFAQLPKDLQEEDDPWLDIEWEIVDLESN